jgi:hypothetical protein
MAAARDGLIIVDEDMNTRRTVVKRPPASVVRLIAKPSA